MTARNSSWVAGVERSEPPVFLDWGLTTFDPSHPKIKLSQSTRLCPKSPPPFQGGARGGLDLSRFRPLTQPLPGGERGFETKPSFCCGKKKKSPRSRGVRGEMQQSSLTIAYMRRPLRLGGQFPFVRNIISLV